MSASQVFNAPTY